MLTVYYYASEEMERFDSPQHELMPDYGATVEMLRKIVEDNAEGHPPFTIFIPSDLIWGIAETLPKSLLSIEVQRNDTCDAVGEIVIYFSYQHSASLFYRRQKTAICESCTG